MTPLHELVPAARPTVSRDGVLSFIDDGEPLPPFPFLVGRRGYFGDAMGAVHENDIGIYDDGIWLLERDRLTAWNANCDPGRHLPGMANLKAGRWHYRPGIHNLSKDPREHPHYEALVQAGPVTVLRDGDGEQTGYFGINIHCGGEHSTSSLGCQTIPPVQWGDKFTPRPPNVMPLIHAALEAEARNTPGHDTLIYVLTSRYG